MAITKSAKKAIRVSARKRVFNLRRKRAVHDVLKQLEKLVADQKTAEAQALLSKAYQAIDKAKKTGVLKANTAARRKAKVARMIASTR